MTTSRIPVVFIHGLSLLATSWASWVDLFREAGYEPAAPGWPGIPDTVEAARSNPDSIAGHGIDDVTEHYAGIIGKLPARPILIGHSFGGMIAEKLLGLDHGAAAIGIDAAQIKGVLPLPLSALRSTLPVFKNPANKHKSVSLTAEQFFYSFGNALPEEESNELYQRWTIPAPGQPLFEAAEANFSLHSPAKVETGNTGRGPLLLVMGGQDHTVPEAITKSTLKQYRHSSAVTDLEEFADRGHSLTIDHGWRDVADACLAWLGSQDCDQPGSTVDTMMALRAHARGGPEQLVYEQAPVPVPGPGEALVAVHAAGITFAELTWDLSWTTRDGRDRTPVIPAHEMSGTVAGVADGVSGVAAGDEVFALIGFDRDGAAADYVTVPASDLAAKPGQASHAEAAALPLAALTAWQALTDHAAVEPGERVLVQGGAGGVGAFAVQLAAILGARVTATGRGRDAGFVRRLGAETFIGVEDGSPPARGADVVIDTVGGAVLEASYGLLRVGGRLVALSAPPSPQKAKSAGVHAMFFVVTPDAAELARLAALVDDGRLQAVVSQTFGLRDGRRAYESGARPRPPGKTVLMVR